MKDVNPCQAQINEVLLKAGRLIFPGERDVTEIIIKTSAAIGLPYPMRSTATSPNKPDPPAPPPAFACPTCGNLTMTVDSICPKCKDSQGGKYHTMLKCSVCHFTEVSPLFLIQQFKRLGFDFHSGLKQHMGIKTLTDEGVK